MENNLYFKEFGDFDWIEVRPESHHPYAMCTVAGNGVARRCYEAMPPKMSFEEAVEFIEEFEKLPDNG